MNILITGSSGNIGNYLVRHLGEKHNIIGFEKDQLNISDRKEATQILTAIKPDVVIHAAALTNIDYCEVNEKKAYEINTIGTFNIAGTCNSLNIPMVYLSTGYVYSGTKDTPYCEKDSCSPVNIYGKTKLAAENLVRTICSKYFILRTSWVFGGEACFVKQVLKNTDIPIFMSSTEVLNATYIGDLCSAIDKVISSEAYGIYNCANNGSMRKIDMIREIFRNAKIRKEVLELPEGILDAATARPKCTAMDISAFEKTFDVKMEHYGVRLKQYMKSIL
jgi:dTDP-4-dehydrorhamnose reductase